MIILDSYKEETPTSIIYKYNIPNIIPEDIIVRVKNKYITLSFKDAPFTNTTIPWNDVDFKITKDSVKVWVLGNTLSIEITKPEDYEFEIKL